MATQIEISKQLNYYKKKRMYFLFFLLLWFVFIGATYTLLNQFLVSSDVALTVLFIQMILFMVWFYLFIPLFQQHSMQFFYYLMLFDQVLEKRSGIELSEKAIFESFHAFGFQRQIEREAYIIFSMIGERTHTLFKSGVVFIVYIKDNRIPYFSEDIESDLNKIKEKVLKLTRIQKEYMIQIRTMQHLKAKDKDELNQVISYVASRQSIIHVNVGLDLSQKTYYALRPLKRYPNRAYYETILCIDHLFKGETYGKSKNRKPS